MTPLVLLLLLQSASEPQSAVSEELLTRRLLLLSEYATAKVERMGKEQALEALGRGDFDAASDSTLRQLTYDLGEAEQRLREAKKRFAPDSPECHEAAARVSALEAKVRSAREDSATYFEAERREALEREKKLESAIREIQKRLEPPPPSPPPPLPDESKIVERIVEVPAKSPPPKTGERRLNLKDELTYVFVGPGTFRMGCVDTDRVCEKNETPAHAVTLTRGFWLGQVEVSVNAYSRFAKVKGSSKANPGGKGTQNPVIGVSHEEASAFCESVGGRLPTEAEWEFSAKAGRGELVYPWGNNADHEHANFWGRSSRGGRDKYDAELAPVGTFLENAWGLRDMNGNVAEWVSDYYAAYSSEDQTDPKGPSSGTERVVRGGSFAGNAKDIRTTVRVNRPGTAANFIGFRCVVDNLGQ